MTSSSGGQHVYAAVPPPPPTLTTSYATILNPNIQKTSQPEKIPKTCMEIGIKKPDFINGRHKITWHSNEIQESIIQTDLQYAIMGKFKYRNPDINELRRVIPVDCNIKGEVAIGVLEPRLILIRCTLKEDYVNLLSHAGFSLKLKKESILMRTLKWETWYDSKKETSTAMAWISFPNLPPNLFAIKYVYSIALAIGKPLHVDMATKNNTRPSCARIKVEVDLLKDLPQEIEVGEHNDDGKLLHSRLITIRYDYLPKYCKTCWLQGHNEDECYSLHPELFKRKEDNKEDKLKGTMHHAVDTTSIFTSGRLVLDKGPSNEWQQGKNKRSTVPKTNDTTNAQAGNGQKKLEHGISTTYTTKEKEKGDNQVPPNTVRGQPDKTNAIVLYNNKFTVLDDVEETEEGELMDSRLHARAHGVQQDSDDVRGTHLPGATEKFGNGNCGNKQGVMGNALPTGKDEIMEKDARLNKIFTAEGNTVLEWSDTRQKNAQNVQSDQDNGMCSWGDVQSVQINGMCSGVQQFFNSSQKKESYITDKKNFAIKPRATVDQTSGYPVEKVALKTHCYSIPSSDQDVGMESLAQSPLIPTAELELMCNEARNLIPTTEVEEESCGDVIADSELIENMELTNTPEYLRRIQLPNRDIRVKTQSIPTGYASPPGGYLRKPKPKFKMPAPLEPTRVQPARRSRSKPYVGSTK